MGYGIVTDLALDLWQHPDEFQFSIASLRKLHASEGPRWVLRMDWKQVRSEEEREWMRVSVPAVGLEEVEDPNHIQSHLEDIGVNGPGLPIETPMPT